MLLFELTETINGFQQNFVQRPTSYSFLGVCLLHSKNLKLDHPWFCFKLVKQSTSKRILSWLWFKCRRPYSFRFHFAYFLMAYKMGLSAESSIAKRTPVIAHFEMHTFHMAQNARLCSKWGGTQTAHEKIFGKANYSFF